MKKHLMLTSHDKAVKYSKGQLQLPIYFDNNNNKNSVKYTVTVNCTNLVNLM